jgi:hypothetical protein
MIRDQRDFSLIKDLALIHFDQESIMIVNKDGSSNLIYQDGSLENIGTMKELSEDQAMNLDAWTKIDGSYYTAS